MEWFIAVVVVAALGVAAIVAAGGLGSMSTEPTRDVFRQDLPTDRALTGDDLQRLRFGVAIRGYAMNQVDDVLDRLSGELVERDQRIADLEAVLQTSGVALPDVGSRPPPNHHDDTAVDQGDGRLPASATTPGPETLP